MKLARAVGILSKLRKKANADILKVVYLSLFGSHLLYGCQLWGQSNIETQTKMRCLQSCALKKSFLGHLMRQLMICTNSAKYLSLRTCCRYEIIYVLEQDMELAKTFISVIQVTEKHNCNTRSVT